MISDDLEKKRQIAITRYGSITSTEEQVTKILGSVNDFETRFLTNQANSRLALYQRINGLISAYGLVNTTGPDYAPLEVNDPNARQQQQEGGRARFISVFPGDYVTMTVEGSYQNLRGFISQIEQSNEFIVISAVELEPAENKEKEANDQTQATQAGITNTQPQPKVDRGKTQGETVTLRLELASYYRRPNFNPQSLETNEVQ
jgi:ribosomal protein L24